jgi:hypothetical protein
MFATLFVVQSGDGGIKMQSKSEAFLQQSAPTCAARHHEYWNEGRDFGMDHGQRRPAESGADKEWF